jgi:hypothetical protein
MLLPCCYIEWPGHKLCMLQHVCAFQGWLHVCATTMNMHCLLFTFQEAWCDAHVSWIVHSGFKRLLLFSNCGQCFRSTSGAPAAATGFASQMDQVPLAVRASTCCVDNRTEGWCIVIIWLQPHNCVTCRAAPKVIPRCHCRCCRAPARPGIMRTCGMTFNFGPFCMHAVLAAASAAALAAGLCVEHCSRYTHHCLQTWQR